MLRITGCFRVLHVWFVLWLLLNVFIIIISFYFVFSNICFCAVVSEPKHCDYHYDDLKAIHNICVIGKCSAAFDEVYKT
jgi:hypothetical protein